MEPLYRLTELLGRRPLRYGLRWQVEGQDRIPASGPVLVASNHVSYFDPIAVAYVTHLAGRRARFMAKAELFERRWTRAVVEGYGAIRVDRGRADASVLQRAAEVIGTGECVVVFPEGTLSRDLEPMAGKTGVARLARAVGVPVVPLGMWGTHRIIPPDRRRLPQPGTAVTAVVGEPVVVGPRDNPREATDRIMAAVCAAVSRARAIYPQRPRRARDAWWDRPPETARLRSCRGRVAQQMLDEAQNH